jgi:hypothetical protein
VGACANFKSSLCWDRVNNGTSLEIKDYFKTFKKGSRGLRKIISNKKRVQIENLQSVKTFVNLTGAGTATPSQLTLLFSMWGNTNFTNRFREFAFKFSNNSLGINTRVSHFIENVARACTFCSMTTPLPIPVPEETFLHLFYTCDSVKGIREKFFRKYLSDLDDAENTKKTFGLA